MRTGMIWAIVAMVLGLGLRGYHYFRSPTVWQDEAALIVNVLEKDYVSLLGPLDLHQAAPPLFLWVEKGCSELLGDGALALRFPPFLASCVALLLVLPIARRLLSARAVPWAVLLFACSETLIRHGFEVKPYAFDVLAATLLIFLYTCRDALGLVWQLIAFSALAPLLLWSSYPACFLYGGVIVALLPSVWQDRRWRTYAAFGLLVATVGISFLVLVLGPARVQQQDSSLVNFWVPFYPDWERPWTVPFWTTVATFELGRYASRPLGQGLIALVFVGGVYFWRGGRRDVVTLLVAPIGLALLASFMHRYPYGGFRLMVFAAPLLLFLAAAGVPRALAWLRMRNRFAPNALRLFLMIPFALALSRVAQPWSVADARSAAEYVETRGLPDDPVTGNDWTHHYYFRDRCSEFQELPVASISGDRVWVVWTQIATPEERIRNATKMAPLGWNAIDLYESMLTTTLLFTRTE